MTEADGPTGPSEAASPPVDALEDAVAQGLPLVVVCEEEATGAATYVGPFAALEDALRAAAMTEADSRAHPGEEVRCSVVPLLQDPRPTDRP